MGAAYGYSLDREAVACLLLCPARERRLLVAALEKMARYPLAIGDLREIGPDGREYQMFDIGDFVVTCWPDHAVKTLRILSIERI
jgi:hypothetical protein